MVKCMTDPPAFRLHVGTEHRPLNTPFRIIGHTWEALEVVVVELEAERVIGQGEAEGVYYRRETADSITRQIEEVRCTVESGDLTIEALQALLPPGGARNALDCALWNSRAKTSGQPVWRLASLAEPHALTTTFTCGAETPQVMAKTARSYVGARAIKLKLTGDTCDAARGDSCARGGPRRMARRGHESRLHPQLARCAWGGLTEALAMARTAKGWGLELMAGNMLGTSLAMVPAYLVGHLCSVVDLDGPGFLTSDRARHIEYADGLIHCPAGIWGTP